MGRYLARALDVCCAAARHNRPYETTRGHRRGNKLSTTQGYSRAIPGQWRSARMTRSIRWNGTTDEALAQMRALQAHCECRIEAGRTLAPCSSHLMLAYDQRAVDGLLFMRRIAERLLHEE